MPSELPTIPEAISDLTALRLFARIAADGALSGLHRSGLFGSSVNFAEHKPYTSGDDLKHLDWKVLARVDKHYLKKFEDETNVRVHLVVDTSASMGFGTVGYTKLDFARVLAATLAHLFLEQHDLVSLLSFGGLEPNYIPPRGRWTHFQTLSEELLSLRPSGTGRLSDALGVLRERVQHKAVIIVVSDFLSGTEKLEALARVFESRRYDVRWIHVLDPAEVRFPFRDWARFEGMEGEEPLETNALEAATAYRKELDSWMRSLREAALAHEIRYGMTETTEPIQRVLAALSS